MSKHVGAITRGTESEAGKARLACEQSFYGKRFALFVGRLGVDEIANTRAQPIALLSVSFCLARRSALVARTVQNTTILLRAQTKVLLRDYLTEAIEIDDSLRTAATR